MFLQKSIQRLLLTVLALCTLLVLYVVLGRTRDTEHSFDRRAHPLFSSDDFRQALSRQQMEPLSINRSSSPSGVDYRGAWFSIQHKYNGIWMRLKERMRIWKCHSDVEELKYFLEFNPPTGADECNVITLGIGRSVDVERELSKKYPHCHFLGVDPSPLVNKDLFEQLPRGKFVQAAIHGHTGTFKGLFMAANPMDWSYGQKTLQHMGIEEFFRRYNYNGVIDMLMVDVEGAEFEILRKFINNYSVLPVVCQLNIEFHYPLEDFNITYEDFFGDLHRFTETYALLNVDMSANVEGLMRAFFVNYKDSRCIRKFMP